MSKKVNKNNQQIIFNLRREILLTPWLAIFGFLGFSILGFLWSSMTNDGALDFSGYGALLLAVLVVPVTTAGILLNRVIRLHDMRKSVPGVREYIARTKMPTSLRILSMIGIGLILLFVVPIIVGISVSLADNW